VKAAALIPLLAACSPNGANDIAAANQLRAQGVMPQAEKLDAAMVLKACGAAIRNRRIFDDFEGHYSGRWVILLTQDEAQSGQLASCLEREISSRKLTGKLAWGIAPPPPPPGEVH